MRIRPRPRLELSDDTKAELTKLLDASPERAERALREVGEWLGVFISAPQQRTAGLRRGAPANTTLMETARLLRLVFRRHYRGPTSGRATQQQSDHFQGLAPQEERELRFVQAAFQSIDVSLSRGLQQLRDTQHLRRLFLDPRCSTPLGRSERTKEVERIAKKSRKRQQPALALAEKIRLGKLADGFTARDLLRKSWLHLRTNAQVRSALDRLIRDGWLQAASRPAGSSGGRPTVEYKILRTAAEPWEFDSSDGTDET